ncbi:MAG: hypothetical protein AB8B80_02495 [Marinicellaceae bacterium]
MKLISYTKIFTLTFILALLASWIMGKYFTINVTQSLIYTHVVLGGAAFLIGAFALFSKKGSPLHKQTGKLFTISMLASVVLSIIVSILPGHVSPTMFHIGLLTLYFLIGGKRSLALKNPNPKIIIDKLLSYTIIIVSIMVMSYSVILDGNLHPLRTVFGTIGIGFGIIDLLLFKQPTTVKSKWLILHLSKMLGGYTAAVTAFFVAQNILTGYYNWFAPTAIGLAYITFWLIKSKTFRPVLAS